MLKIKKALLSDWKIIQELNNIVFLNDKSHDDDLDLGWPFSEEGIKYYQELAKGKSGHCLIAYIDDKPIGYIALTIKDLCYRKSKYIEINNMGVKPEYRSKGIGKNLINSAIKWAKTKGATRLYVDAYWKNKKAIKFYKNNNFYEIGIELEKKI